MAAIAAEALTSALTITPVPITVVKLTLPEPLKDTADASTGGNLLYHSPLDTSKTIDTGDIFKISTGNLSVTLA